MKLLSALVIASLVSVASFAAEETKWEITGNWGSGGTNGGLTITSTSTAGVAGAGAMSWGLQGGVFYSVMPWVQVGLIPQLGSTGTSTSTGTNISNTMTWMALVGVNLNFPMDGNLKDAFFLGLKVGYGSSTTTVGTAAGVGASGLAWGAEIGKRFAIFNNISWRPSFGLLSSTMTATGATTGTTSMSWVLNLLAVSLVW